MVDGFDTSLNEVLLSDTHNSSDQHVAKTVDINSGNEQSQPIAEPFELSINRTTTVRTYQRRSRTAIVPTEDPPKIDVAVNATVAISEPIGIVSDAKALRASARRGRASRKNITTPTKMATESDTNDSLCSTSFSGNSTAETVVGIDSVDTKSNASKFEANSCDSLETQHRNQTVSNTVTNCAGTSDTQTSTKATTEAEPMLVDIPPKAANGKLPTILTAIDFNVVPLLSVDNFHNRMFVFIWFCFSFHSGGS